MYAKATPVGIAVTLAAGALWATPGRAGSLTFYPTDDAYVNMRSRDTNYGSSGRILISNGYGGPTHTDTWEKNALVKFDLSSIIPGTDIPSATLYLYFYDHWDNHPGGRELTCYRILDDWDEGVITFNTQPGIASVVTSSSAVPSRYGWMSWDVTDDVRAAIADPASHQGWMIKDENIWDWYDIPVPIFYSKENDAVGVSPYLEVIPEPATLTLVLVGGIGLGHLRRSCRRTRGS